MTFNVGETKFIKTKFSGLDGQTMVGWQEEDSTFEVRVSGAGIWFQGTMKMRIYSMDELQDFARLISEAQHELARLKPKIATSFKDDQLL